MRVSIISKLSNLNQKIAGFIRKANEIRDEMQNLAVNTVYHAAKHGDASPLNTFFQALSKGDQASFKRWIVAEVAKPYGPDHKLTDLFIGMSKGDFFVKKDAMDKRTEFNAMVNEILADDRAEDYGKFFGIDPDRTKNPFDNLSILKDLDRLIKRASADDANVSTTVMSALTESVTLFKTKAGAELTAHATVQ